MKLSQQQIEFILQNENKNVHEIALKFDKKKYPDLDIGFLLKQIAGRQIAKTKIPGWYKNQNIIYPVHLSMEQASSEITAKYKSGLFLNHGGKFADLTGGLGVDFSFISQQFSQSFYVEQDDELCETAKYNFEQLLLNGVTVVNNKAENFISNNDGYDLIYLDPSRRDIAGRKVIRIEDCVPNLSLMQKSLAEKSQMVLVKYSPMLDVSRALRQLNNVSGVHVVSVDNECRELLFVLSEKVDLESIVTVNLKSNGTSESFVFTHREEKECTVDYTSKILRYLYEPNASILKAGAFKSVGRRFNLKKLHINSHLYTSDDLMTEFPGRIFEVISYFVPTKRNIKSFVSKYNKANIAVRNYPDSVGEIRKKTGIKDGGDTYLFASTMLENKKIWLVCQKTNIV